MNAITSDEGRDWVDPASESQGLRVRTLNPINDPQLEARLTDAGCREPDQCPGRIGDR